MKYIKIPKTASNSAIYVTFNVLQKALNFFLLPLYTIYLTPEDYGITNVLLSVSSLLTVLLTFSLQSASARFHYQYKEETSKLIWGSNYIFIIFNSFFWTVVVCLFYKYSLKFLIGDDISFFPYALLGILNCCFAPIYLYFQTYLQTTQRAKFFVLNSSLYFALQLGLTILFVVFFNWRALGVLLAQLIVNVAFAFYAIISLRKYITYRFSRIVLKKSLGYAVPLLPHNLSGWLSGMLDRIFINRIVNLASVGLYSIGSQIGTVTSLISMGINQAYVPFFFANHSSLEGKKKIELFSDLGIGLVLIISLFLVYFAPEILYLMTDAKYHSVWPVIIIVVLGNMFDCIYKFTVSVLFLDNTKQLSLITISCSLLTCLLNVVLITSVGYIGAAVSFAIVQFLICIVVCVYAKKLRPDINFKVRLYFLEVIVSFLVAFTVVYTTAPSAIESRFAFKIPLFLISSVLLLFLNKDSFIRLSIIKNEK